MQADSSDAGGQKPFRRGWVESAMFDTIAPSMVHPYTFFHSRFGYLALVVCFSLSGCLPSSCSQGETRDINPTDSLSRAIAEAIPVDTLTVLDTLMPVDPALEYPLSLRYRTDGSLWVGDASGHAIVGFSESGDVLENVHIEGLEYPYVVGFRSDTLLVFTPADPRILVILNGVELHSFPVPDDRPSNNGLQYVTASQNGYYYKVIDDDFEGYIAELNLDGEETGRVNLTGDYWRYAGALRMWDTSLISLSGFLPQVYRIHGFESNMSIDSLALKGFDSPMLARTRQFMLKDLTQPPLLTSAAVGIGERLFVLNMRPGWLRIDVYDTSGTLEVVLTQPNPSFNTDYFPSDLAVRKVSDESEYELAVTIVEPEARVDRFRWKAR